MAPRKFPRLHHPKIGYNIRRRCEAERCSLCDDDLDFEADKFGCNFGIAALSSDTAAGEPPVLCSSFQRDREVDRSKHGV
jgi:hypothetical protein